jgi:diaminohydroxyphosphoribosylaminopyrimidine deaminase/5-amino-6-(5-phosphoribosylamino)uracil reductase
MVEGGARIAASFIAASLVDEAWLLRGPDPIGDEGLPALGPLPLDAITRSSQFKVRASERLDQDILTIYERA